MAWRTPSSFLVLLLLAGCAFAQVPNPGNSPPTSGPPEAKPAPLPDPVPLPPDVKSPQDVPPGADANPSGNPVTRTLKRLAPNCVNAVFHTCWSSPSQKPQPPQTDARKGAASRDVGEFYLAHGNYHAAESRFREALTYDSGDARTMFDLGLALEKLDQIHQASIEYQACIDVKPDGAYTARCHKALDHLISQASSRQP